MSNFVKHFADMFTKDASVSACSSCGAVNTATNFNFIKFADTVFSVSVLLCSLISIIGFALLGLIYVIILANIIIINIICLKKIFYKKRNIIKF